VKCKREGELVAMSLEVVSWKEPFIENAIKLLGLYEESSLFLLGNLRSYGHSLGEQANSGNFRIVLKNGKVVAVFVLTKRGKLLLNSDREQDYSQVILDAALAEGLPLKGVLGDWDVAAPLWAALKNRRPHLKASFESKEILYRRFLLSLPVKSCHENFEIRVLRVEDFLSYKPLRLAYLKEEGLRQDLSDEQFYEDFLKLVKDQIIWGFFRGEKLLSMARLNARIEKVGQVGGVYTLPSDRRKGLAKAVLAKLMRDSREIHGLEKMILFTGELNHAAQKVYEGLGFERIGHYGIILE
jgi:predicted GNAT family acetyltransferase